MRSEIRTASHFFGVLLQWFRPKMLDRICIKNTKNACLFLYLDFVLNNKSFSLIFFRTTIEVYFLWITIYPSQNVTLNIKLLNFRSTVNTFLYDKLLQNETSLDPSWDTQKWISFRKMAGAFGITVCRQLTKWNIFCDFVVQKVNKKRVFCDHFRVF